MFVETVFPFTDLRTFYLDRRGKVVRPQWPSPRIREPNQRPDFIRGLGAVAPRPRGGVTGRAGEDRMCDAESALVFPRFLDRDWLHFRRFFSDGGMFARLSVGISTWHFGWDEPYPIDVALERILKIPTRVGPMRLAFPQRELIFAGSDLAHYLQYRTTRHAPIESRVNGYDKKGPLYVYPEAPVLFVEAPLWELERLWGDRTTTYDRERRTFSRNTPDKWGPSQYAHLLTSASQIISIAALPGSYLPPTLVDVVAWTTRASDGGLIRCFMLVRQDEAFRAQQRQGAEPNIRALRIHLLRLVVERQNIRRLFEWLEKIDQNNPELDHHAIEEAFDSAYKLLQRASNRYNVTRQLAEHLACDYIDTMHAGESESLRASVERIFARRRARANAYAFLASDKECANRSQSQRYVNVIYAGKVDIMSGDIFSNIQNSTIVNRSLVERAFNKAKSEAGEETAEALRKIAEAVAASGNKEAGEIFDQFNEELARPQPRKSLLRTSWENLVQVLPTVATIAGAAAAIAKLFA